MVHTLREANTLGIYTREASTLGIYTREAIPGCYIPREAIPGCYISLYASLLYYRGFRPLLTKEASTLVKTVRITGRMRG